MRTEASARWSAFWEVIAAALVLAGLFAAGLLASGSLHFGARHSGPPLGGFQSQNLKQVREPAPRGFGFPSAKTIHCILPAQWTAGAVAHCYAYDRNGSLVVELADTVLPGEKNGWQWNASVVRG